MKTIGGHTIDETLLTDGVIIDVGCRGFDFANCYNKDLEDRYNYFDGKVIYCIDPDEYVFVQTSGILDTNFKFLNLAISDKSGETTYYPNGEATMIRQFDPDPTYPHIDQKYSKTCKVITMAEYAILGETFKPIPKQISVEFHHHCVPKLHKEKYTAIVERLSKDYTMHNSVWEQRHGCGFNFWDTLFLRKY